MAIENVIDEIISQAEKQKREIVEEGKKESWKMLEEATNRTKQHDKIFAAETARILEEYEKMETSAANIQLHKMLLESKKSILDGLYMQLETKLQKMETAERKEMLLRLIEKSRKEMADAKFVYCNNNDKELISGAGMNFAGPINCLGGVIVENSDRNVRINYTFDILLQNAKEAHLNEIAKRIFKA